MEINLTADEREMLYKLQSMRWSSFQGKPLSKIDGEYQKMVTDDLKQMIERFDASNDECMEFSRQQLHINIALLDVLIFSMDFFIRNDLEAKKPAEDIEEKKQIVETARTLRQKIVSVLLPDPWFGESADIQRATCSCYEIINGWGDAD